MYRDESETLLDGGHSHNLSRAKTPRPGHGPFLLSAQPPLQRGDEYQNVWVCQTVIKNRLNYNSPWLPSADHHT